MCVCLVLSVDNHSCVKVNLTIKFCLQLSILFVDMEGESIQELSAIEMNALTRQIVNVYHAYANTEDPDFYSRRHIHGLSSQFLNIHGFPNESALIDDFKKWLRGKDVLAMYANAPSKEQTALNLPIIDMDLPIWKERISMFVHQTAIAFKKNSVPILNKYCPKHAHDSYVGYPVFRNSPTDLAKRSHGYHCSLYDSYELYLHYVTDSCY